MPRHPDPRVSLERLIKQRSHSFAISRVVTVSKHHCMEAAYLGLFEAIRKEISLPPCDQKMPFRGFPLMCPGRGESRDSLGVAWDWPNHYCSSVDQLADQRVKLSGLRLLSKHEKTL